MTLSRMLLQLMHLFNGGDYKVILLPQVWPLDAFKQVGCGMHKKGHRLCEAMLKMESPNSPASISWKGIVHQWATSEKIKLSLHHGELSHECCENLLAKEVG